MNISGKFISLRAIEIEDLTILNRWANDPSIQEMLGGWHFPTNMNDQNKWYETLSCNSVNQRFAIEAPGLGIIGTANLVNIDWKNRNAFHGILLGDKDIRGRGYGVDTIMTIMRYAFDELGLMRLDGDMIEYNTPSINVYLKKCGWKQEGIKKNWYYRKGRFWDKVVVGVTKDDYQEIIATNHYWD